MTAIGADNQDASTLNEDLANEIRRAVDPYIPRDEGIALLDYPSGPNVGDHAIWLGEKVFLRDADIEVVLECDRSSFSARTIDRRLRKGATLLLHGGGNIGDLWASQQLREKVLEQFPDRRIVQLPQSIHFDHKTNLERAKRVFNAHPHFVLFVRDRRSLDLATQHFEAKTQLCPDTAFLLKGMERLGEPLVDILWLSRTDLESATGRDVPTSNQHVLVTDWLTERPGDSWSLLSHVRVRSLHYAIRLPRLLTAITSPPHIVLERSYDFLSRKRLLKGQQLLSRGRVVVTDRLHAHILCQLMGIPHVLLDNSYGKIKSFWETWTMSSPLVHWADDPKEALEIAAELARS